MVKRLKELRIRLMEIRYMEETGDRVRRSFVRRSFDTDERRDRLRRLFIRPKSERYENILMPQVALVKKLWNMINP